MRILVAFTPDVPTEYGRSAKARLAHAPAVAPGRDQPMHGAIELLLPRAKPAQLLQVGGIFDYMAERVRPSLLSSVRGRDLHVNYVSWCAEGKRAALSHAEFFNEFERIYADDLCGSIRRAGNRYVGLILADALNALPAQRMG